MGNEAPTSFPIEYASYLIRLWREANPAPNVPATDWHGEVEHIQSGRRWTFNALDELLGFLRQQAEGRDDVTSITGRAEPGRLKPPLKDC